MGAAGCGAAAGPGAGLVRLEPAILDAGESFVIEVDGAFGACALAQRPGVKDDEDEEQSESDEQPPRRKGVVMEREPGSNQGRDDEKEAQVSEAAMHFLQMRNLHLAGLPAFLVFL